MSTESLVVSTTPELVKINAFEAKVASLEKDYSNLTINGISDKVGYKKVVEARKESKSVRVSIDKKRKELIEDALSYQRLVNQEAKALTSRVSLVEDALAEKENAYEAEIAYIKAESERLRKEKVKNRVLIITSLDAKFDGSVYRLGGKSISQDEIESISDSLFQDAVEAFEIEASIILNQRLEEERLAKEELDRIEAQRKEQELAAAEIKRQQDELNLERKRIEDEKAAHQAELDRIKKEKDAEIKRQQDAIEAEKKEIARQAELENARKEAAEKAIKEAKIEADRIEAERVKFENAAKEKEARLLAKRPDVEKLKDLNSQVIALVNSFDFKTTEGVQAHVQLKKGIEDLFGSLRI